MYIRRTTVRSGGKTYQYVRLQKTYRRKDGKPSQKVLANLGELPERDIRILEKALKAIRLQKDILLVDEEAGRVLGNEVLSNLRYLDLAVALCLWEEWGMGQWFDAQSMPRFEVPLSAVVAVLMLQRCVAPASKLKATRWYPTTALPELLGIASTQVNNTRVHRVLGELERQETSLQKALATRIASRHGGAIVSLFLDMTDVWFEGRGPAMARTGKTKEGLLKRKVEVALLCDQAGFPLRWRVLQGNKDEARCMWSVIETMSHEEWALGRPLVVDRAMGQGIHVKRFLAEDLPFVTMIPVNEFDSYTDKIPHKAFKELYWNHPCDDLKEGRRLVDEVSARMTMEVAGPRDYLLDLGNVEVSVRRMGISPGSEARPTDINGPGGIAAALRVSQNMQDRLIRGEAINYRDIGKQLGMSHDQVCRRMALRKLVPDIQESIARGNADAVSLTKLVALSRVKNHECQRKEYSLLLKAAISKPRNTNGGDRHTDRSVGDDEVRLLPVRLVAVFNPERFLQQRNDALEQQAKWYMWLDQFNDDLARGRSRRKRTSILAEVARKLRELKLTSAFDAELREPQTGKARHHRVEVTRNEAEWARRRRYDGFNLIATHPDIQHSPSGLLDLYRSRDGVEKDFQTIKSQLEVRPVRHFTDEKVRAHVTICMLALLLHRTVEAKMVQADCPMTASEAFEQLAACHLNQVTSLDPDVPSYSLTRCNADQRRILTALGLERLADAEEVSTAVHPRA